MDSSRPKMETDSRRTMKSAEQEAEQHPVTSGNGIYMRAANCGEIGFQTVVLSLPHELLYSTCHGEWLAHERCCWQPHLHVGGDVSTFNLPLSRGAGELMPLFGGYFRVARLYDVCKSATLGHVREMVVLRR